MTHKRDVGVMMVSEEPLSRRLLDRYGDLPRAERRLADVVLGKGEGLAECGLGELLREAGVSRATAARLFRRLGYPTYRAARAAAQRAQRSLVIAAEAVSHERARTDGVYRDLHLSTDVQNLRHTFESLPPALVEDAVSALADAEKLWVVGFEDDYALAHFARALLIRIKPDIRMLPLGGFSIPEEFASITPQDTILGFGMHRRPWLLRRILVSGRQAQARILLVTNEHVEDEAGVNVLRCRTRGAALFDSVTAAVSLTGYLCAQVAAARGDPAVERLHRIESLYSAWDSNSGPSRSSSD